jgi:hydrogenase maturation protein HypF
MARPQLRDRSMTHASATLGARRIHVQGVVQGVGFRPHVYRLACAHGLHGWVKNGADGVRIHVEGAENAIDAFVRDLSMHPPAAATVVAVDVSRADPCALQSFDICESETGGLAPTTRIAPDLPVCDACLEELFDTRDRRHRYVYVNCTNCGPRFSIVRALPYDRRNTTMAGWPLCESCAAEYADPLDRRFHAQPVACSACGPAYRLTIDDTTLSRGDAAIAAAATLLRDGRIVAVKGIGGYHLCCDGDNAVAVEALRERKYRKEQPFAVMVRDLAAAERTVTLTSESRELLQSVARPIVLARARVALSGVAPDNVDLGVMLPYAPLHHLLFAAAAPDRLVMTSGNRSSEPTVFADEDAGARLGGLADAFLIGERPIARRVDDSVVRVGPLGPVVLRRSRGLAPAAIATLPTTQPILAVGGDLKNSITLVVDGQAYVSQHIGDLSHPSVLEAFEATIQDLAGMYDLAVTDLIVAHDLHPDYASTAHAIALGGACTIAVQHHRAHVASVLAERGVLEQRVLGIAFDGTGYGDDGSIWGGEFFVGSVAEGFTRVGHLRRALLPGGDAAARHPVQAAAGFLSQLDDVGDLSAAPFLLPQRYQQACAVAQSGIRTFRTTSAGRLFDTVAALLGFTRPITFEGQAAMWLEQLGRCADDRVIDFPPMPFEESMLDWIVALRAVIELRRGGVPRSVIAHAFHRSLASGIADAARALANREGGSIVVLSGGVFQNTLLVEQLLACEAFAGLQIWMNRGVPPNDGGLSLGQAALALPFLGR